MQFIYQVFQESPNPTYIKDSKGKIIWANDAYAQLHGTSLPQILEKGALDFDFSYERDIEVLSSYGINEIEEFFKLEDGRGVWYLTVKKTVDQENGTRCLFSTSTEITNLKETIQVAEDSFAAKEKFLAEVNRELEAPINAIISLVRLLKQTFISKDQKRYLNSVLSISDYILDIPKDVLEYARVEAGIVDLTTEVVDVVAFTNGIVQSVASKATEKGVTIRFVEPTATLPTIEINPVYLSLVLVKVIRCAIRYTKTREVVFSIQQKQRVENMLYLQFSIRNIGLDQNSEDLAKLFDSENNFYGNEKYKRSGVDLGVYTCKKLIELQGGKVWLDKDIKQEASIEFTLSFPIVQSQASENSYVPALDKSIHPEHSVELKLLLVDDNESSQALVKHQIQNWDTKIDIAGTGEEGVKLASKTVYDLILMDVELPGMDGFEATSAIRESEGPNQRTPIVAFTTNPGNIDLEEFKAAGFTDYLRKPYHAFDLYLCISRNTGHYASEQLKNNKEDNEKEQLLYDFSGLGNMAEDAVFIRKMQKLFIDLVPGQISKLSLAIQQKDWETVALIAHSLKSTYGNIKVVKAAEAMKKIEQISTSRTNLSEINRLMGIVTETTQKVVEVFSRELDLA
ncbi:ATP-binding response regulator [Rufibacter hautae]|uniref:histidine kinase n=1 Tax=Rufibacter hautae TaxID=2595005 RepID=A0A5B6TCD2_9BACT|nr:response regulator [Rufibacter hautae]KAA3436763.1 response regulator [Rufibacter hautae]